MIACMKAWKVFVLLCSVALVALGLYGAIRTRPPPGPRRPYGSGQKGRHGAWTEVPESRAGLSEMEESIEKSMWSWSCLGIDRRIRHSNVCAEELASSERSSARVDWSHPLAECERAH